MFNKPRCSKARNLPHKQALYCEGKFLCAHQYNCPQTQQYENTADFSKCQRLPKAQETKPQTAPVKFVMNVVPKAETVQKAEKPVKAVDDLAESIASVSDEAKRAMESVQGVAQAVGIYAKNVTPPDYGVQKETEAPAKPEKKPTETTTTRARKETKNGPVRKTRSRRTKKG